MNNVLFFSGLGSEFPNMGKRLYLTNPLFRESMELCSTTAEKYIHCNLVKTLYGEDTFWLKNILIVKYALFAVQYSTATVACERQPSDIFFGFSLGELIALTFAGWISLDDMFAFIFDYTSILKTSPKSKTICLMASYENLLQVVRDLNGLFEVTACLRSNIYAITIQEKNIDRVEKYLKSKSYSYLFLNTEIGFHSSLIDPMYNKITHCLPRVSANYSHKIFSSISSEMLPSLSDNYLWQILRNPFDIPKNLKTIASLPSVKACDMSPTKLYSNYIRQTPSLHNKITISEEIK